MGFVCLKSGVKLYYQIEGNPQKPYLFLAHGYGSDHDTFDQIIPYLSQDFHIIRWDHRGHGQSDKPRGENSLESQKLYQIEILADDLYEMIQNLKLESKPLLLFGTSFGGMVALSFAIKYPSILTALAIGSTTASNLTKKSFNILKMHQAGKLLFDQKSFLQNIHEEYSPEFLKNHPEIIERGIRQKTTVGSQILLFLMENMVLHYNVEDQISQIKIPTIILHGTQDKSINIVNGEKIHKLISNSKFVPLENMNHGAHIENPDIISSILISFFNTLKKEKK